MIDTDKYGNEKRNWKVKDTFPDGASVDVELGWVYEDIVAVKGNGHHHYTVAQMVDTGGADAQLIADAPLILQALIDERAEVKRLQKELEDCWEYILHTDNHDMQSLADNSYKEERDRLRGRLND
jgi:hypothetical protein|tara:strand:+ start:303 stop:677 length:375 start_codon:yes stop_codon:yes gene_type:complete